MTITKTDEMMNATVATTVGLFLLSMIAISWYSDYLKEKDKIHAVVGEYATSDEISTTAILKVSGFFGWLGDIELMGIQFRHIADETRASMQKDCSDKAHR